MKKPIEKSIEEFGIKIGRMQLNVELLELIKDCEKKYKKDEILDKIITKLIVTDKYQ